MRIAILKSRLSYMGGLERYAKAIAIAFAQKSNEVTLLTTGNSVEIEKVNVVSLGPHPSSTLQSLTFFEKAAKAWLKKFPQDIVFGLDRNTFQTHYRAGNGAHKTYLKRAYPFFLGAFKTFLNFKDRKILACEKTLFENSSLKQLFTNSFMVKEELLNQYQISPNKIEVVHNGIDLEKFSLDKTAEEKAKNELKISSKNHLLFIGNNYKRKGLKLILKALSQLKDQDFKLSIIGKDKNIAHYKSLCYKYNLKDKVIFWGPQENLLLFYQSANCLVLPSFYDPFANVTIEALAMGLYVITSSYNGGHEVLTKESGYILNCLKDSKELAQAISLALSLKYDFSKKLMIRKSIQHLEINNQLNKIVNITLNQSSSL